MTIELNKTYTLKLTNADEIVCRIIAENNDSYTVENPLSAVPTEKGIQLIFTVFTAEPKETVTINKSAVAMICTTREEVSDSYLEMTTGIKPVRKSQILMS